MYKILYEKPGKISNLVTADKVVDHMFDIIFYANKGYSITIEYDNTAIENHPKIPGLDVPAEIST